MFQKDNIHPVLEIRLEGDVSFPEYKEHVKEGKIISVSHIKLTALTAGMSSNKTSVALFIDLPDGKVVFAETSLRLFLIAARMLQAKYGEE